MDYLPPPLKAVLEIRLQIENGVSVSQSIKAYSQRNLDDLFAKELAFWLFTKESGQVQDFKLFESVYRKYLLEILIRGLKGEPILESLADLEEMLLFAANEDMEKHLQKLPFISLIPLMFFEFPAFFILLVGPLFLDLLSALEHSGGTW